MFMKNAAFFAFLKCITFSYTWCKLRVFHYNSCHTILITNVSSISFSKSIRRAAIRDEGLMQFQFGLSMLVVESIENTSSIYFHTNMVSNIRIWIYHAILRNIVLALAVLSNLMRLHWIFIQCFSFLFSFSVSIVWIWNNIQLDDRKNRK